MPKLQEFCLLICLTLFAVPGAAHADLMKYTADDGRTYYVDSIEKVPAEYRDQLNKGPGIREISKVKPGRKKLYEKEKYELSQGIKHQVEIYVTDW